MADRKDIQRATSAELAPGDEETQTSPRAVQFPSLAGEPGVEVAERSADGSDGTGYRKTFTVAGPDEVGKDHPCHEHNAIRALEEATQRGLHPKGTARLVNTEVVDRDRRGVVSTACTYEVEVVPSVIDREARTTVTPSSGKRVTERSTPTG